VRVLDELERDIARLAAEAGDVRRRRRWWRSGTLVIALPLALAAAAVAATSAILTGEPVKNPPGLQLNPKAGLGVIVGSGKLLDVRAADPDGGPDWALRMVKTSRGLGCVQLGRLVDGKLGVLGRDGAFGNDGKFHERGAQILQQTDCQQTDGAGHVFIAMTYQGLPASGDATGCIARANTRLPRPVCPPGSLRTIYYGLLGPQAKALTYRDANDTIVRQRVSRPEGAYLVVLPTDPKRRNIGYYSPGVTPATGLRSVEYRDGSVCRIINAQRLGGARHCPLKGFIAPNVSPISSGDLATKDADGYYFIVGRKKDMIIRGGYNVYPREIEDAFSEHEAVAEVAVIGLQHADLGEDVGAAVVLTPGADVSVEQLQAFVKERVAAYKYPRRVWIVDELPKDPSGKILRREVVAPERGAGGR